MATNSSSRGSTELLLPKKWNSDRETSPERTVVWTEPKSSSSKTEKRVPVIYYLSRNGQFEHPHFIQVPLSSPEGLYLKDVINRLNVLRGEGMASMFSWSSKRSYKNGYVWHDLSEDDLIYPVNGRDYVLKGSELLPRSVSFRMCETASKTEDSGEIHKLPASIAERRTRNQSWDSFDNNNPQNDYRAMYKSESSREFSAKFPAEVGTQKAESRPGGRGGRTMREAAHGSKSVELSREELPSPPSISSWEYTDGVSRSGNVHRRTLTRDHTAENDLSSGRVKASRVVMHLITCGSSTTVDSALTKSKSRNKF
nr:protein UPSTREAM OF FLC-like [Ipomoea batatas]